MHCEEDKMWLYTHCLPFIEEYNGYKLCIHDRNFHYGRLIVDNIAENMNKSKNIVLILSENFTKSSWCQFEVLLAHNRFVKQVADSLDSIKLEDIAHDLMTNSLETLIKFATHAIWSEYEHSREILWVKILECFENQNGSNDIDIFRKSYSNRSPTPVYKTTNDNSSKEQTTNENSSKEQTTNDNSSKEQITNDNSSKEQTTNDNSSKEQTASDNS
jgi:toll-like receptor 13